ncbi:MAG TPA: hypothetical protein VJB90_05060 [Candidatus Nanoarchaeia archaeon]|nr:hypothetical protein [Candidatus Nanoarchaeia archaeon]
MELDRLFADYGALDASVKYFQGKFSYTYDDKGRIAVPAEFRSVLDTIQPESSVLALTLWREDDLVGIEAFPELFFNVEARLINMSDPKRRHEFGTKYFLITIDNQGRILIPQYLAKEADLTKGCRMTIDGNTETFVFYRTNPKS